MHQPSPSSLGFVNFGHFTRHLPNNWLAGLSTTTSPLSAVILGVMRMLNFSFLPLFLPFNHFSYFSDETLLADTSLANNF